MTDWPSFAVQLGTGLVTLAALVVAIVGTYRATAQAKQSQEYIESRDAELEQREADAKAVVQAERQAASVHIEANWSDTSRPWVKFWVQVFSDDENFVVELVRVELEAPLRHNVDTERSVVFEAVPPAMPQSLIDGLPWSQEVVQAYLEQGQPLPSRPTVAATFRDRFGNWWRLGSDRSLTLLTPRRIVSLSQGDATK